MNNNNATDVSFEWMPQKIIFVHGLKNVELCIFEIKYIALLCEPISEHSGCGSYLETFVTLNYPQEETDVQTELEKLDRERMLHIRELKRIQNEDSSK